MPDDWKFAAGMKLTVRLAGNGSGTMTLTKELKPGVWLMDWDYPASQLHGRTFEMGKEGFSNIHAPGTPITWPMLIRLLPKTQLQGNPSRARSGGQRAG